MSANQGYKPMNSGTGGRDSRASIEAYDDVERATTYDTAMDLMHPLRHKMADVAMQVLPFPRDARLTALELGAGSGFFHYVVGLTGHGGEFVPWNSVSNWRPVGLW